MRSPSASSSCDASVSCIASCTSPNAAAVYEELLGLSTDLPSIKILIELREQSGDVPGQLELLRQQVGLVTDRAERLSLLRRMMALCDQRMLQRGESIDAQDSLGMTIWVCRALLNELPNDRDALKRLSDALQLLGNKSELVDVLEAYLKVAPTPREKLGLHRQIAKIAEDNEDLPRAVSHLERAVRICPPGPESEEVLCELARIYGRQARIELAVQTLELCLKQNPRAGADLQRLLGRLTQRAKTPRSWKRAFAPSVKSWPASLTMPRPGSLQRLYRKRGDWAELKAVLERQLTANDPPLPLRDKLSVALELSEVYSEHLKDPRGAAALIERVQADTPIVDLRVHRRLRVLFEELGEYNKAARYAERELLLTEDPVARMERAFDIATMWQTRGKGQRSRPPGVRARAADLARSARRCTGSGQCATDRSAGAGSDGPDVHRRRPLERGRADRSAPPEHRHRSGRCGAGGDDPHRAGADLRREAEPTRGRIRAAPAGLRAGAARRAAGAAERPRGQIRTVARALRSTRGAGRSRDQRRG